MRTEIKRASFKLWRERVPGHRTKHLTLHSDDIIRAYCPTQYKNR